MKVDFNQIKTTISLPDFLLELGWKIVEGSSNSCPKMSNGTHRYPQGTGTEVRIASGRT